MALISRDSESLPAHYRKIESFGGSVTIELIEGVYGDKNICQIRITGPAILEPALIREGYSNDELLWIKDVANDDSVIRDELLLLNNLAVPLSKVAEMLVAQLHSGTERIKSGDNALAVLQDLIQAVKFST